MRKKEEKTKFCKKFTKKYAYIYAIITLLTQVSYKSGEIYYADITPDFNVLLPVSRHFEKRMPNEKWIIRDLKRKTAALHFEKETVIAEMTEIIKPNSCADETERVWREFYNSISIDSRRNEKLRRNMMPQRYWENMTEFKIL